MEALGYSSFYGFTPSINLFKGSEELVYNDTQDINVLLSECSDIRHILKSISDIVPLQHQR
jgi:hypothetical protein